MDKQRSSAVMVRSHLAVLYRILIFVFQSKNSSDTRILISKMPIGSSGTSRGVYRSSHGSTRSYVDLHGVAEGESGSVYAARVVDSRGLMFPITTSLNQGEDGEEIFVAIKNIPILPSGSPRLAAWH
jgi:hypothetical protein